MFSRGICYPTPEDPNVKKANLHCNSRGDFMAGCYSTLSRCAQPRLTEEFITRLAGYEGHPRLNEIRVRGIRKVTVQCLLSVIVLQAQAVATGCRASVRKVA